MFRKNERNGDAWLVKLAMECHSKQIYDFVVEQSNNSNIILDTNAYNVISNAIYYATSKEKAEAILRLVKNTILEKLPQLSYRQVMQLYEIVSNYQSDVIDDILIFINKKLYLFFFCN